MTGATLRGEGDGAEHRGPPSDGHTVDTAPGHEAQGRWSLLEGGGGSQEPHLVELSPSMADNISSS